MTNPKFFALHNLGVFELFDLATGRFAKSIVIPHEVDETTEAERAWFDGWCRANNIEATFEDGKP